MAGVGCLLESSLSAVHAGSRAAEQDKEAVWSGSTKLLEALVQPLSVDKGGLSLAHRLFLQLPMAMA